MILLLQTDPLPFSPFLTLDSIYCLCHKFFVVLHVYLAMILCNFSAILRLITIHQNGNVWCVAFFTF